MQDEGRGKLVDDSSAARLATRGMVARGFQRGLGFGGGEALIPEVDREADSFRIGAIFAIFVGLDGRLGDQLLQLIHKAMDTLGLKAAVSGEMQRVADDDAGTVVAARQAEDGALVAAGLAARDGEERLRDAEGVGERNPYAACADIEAQPGLHGLPPGLRLTRKWHSRHAFMIARGARSGDYNRRECFD